MSRLQDPTLKDGVQGSMQTGQGVQLPFVAPLLWWKNGETALTKTAEITDARRFGGWGVSEEEIVNAGMELPNNWNMFELSGSKGNDYNAYLARFVYVAPIDRRFAWFQKPETGSWVSKLNILAYMGEMTAEKKMIPWGPVVLSAKGYSGQHIDNAFKKFMTETAKLRDGDPSNYFYHPIGTFAKEPIFEKVTGKGGSSSPITPCQLFVPNGGYTVEDMDRYFVGDEIAAVMVDLRDQAREWLSDWNRKKEQTEADEVAPLPNDDEFPF